MSENQIQGDGIASHTTATPTATTATEGGSSSTVAKSKGKGGKSRSTVWDHFTQFTDEEGLEKSKCNYCGNEYCSNPKKNGTSSLLAHMKKCQKYPANVSLKQAQLNLQPIVEGVDENMGSLTPWKFDQDLCRKKLNEMIIKDELPFRLVEGEGFKEFVNTLQPRFKIPSRWTISRDCYQLFLCEKERLCDLYVETCQSVCITTDTWTSLQKLNYICITAHFIDRSWKLNKRIINFCTIEKHKGDEMGRLIDNCLREWGIARVFSCTVDNAASNDTCLSYLKTRLTSRDCSVVKGKYLHMRCVAHIIALVVNDGLKEIGSSVKRIRDAVRYVRQSPSRLVKFRECCEEENISSKSLLCLDVPTRWNSTYLMLSVACKFERAFEQFDAKDPFFRIDLEDGVPMGFDWDNAKMMRDLLQAFYELTLRISGSLYVTCNEFLHEITTFSDILREWEHNEDENVRKMGAKMRTKFHKYWGDPTKMNKIIFMSVIVDPRYKYKFLEFVLIEEWGEQVYWGDPTKMNKIIFMSVIVDPRYKYKFLEFVLIEEWGEQVGKELAQSVLDSLHELYGFYKGLHDTPSSGLMTSQSSHQTDSSSSTMKNRVMVNKYKKQRVQEGVISSIDELDVYCKEAVVGAEEDFDILYWWKLNQHRFPILSTIARDILAVPISTVASKSAFSAGGRVLDPFRSSLTPKIVESLICTQDWLRRSKDQISIEEDMDAIMLHEEGLKGLSLKDKNEVDQARTSNTPTPSSSTMKT